MIRDRQFQGRNSLIRLMGWCGDPSDDVGEPGLRINMIHLRGINARAKTGGAFTSRVRVHEHVVLPTQNRRPHPTFRGVVRHFEPAVIEDRLSAVQRGRA